MKQSQTKELLNQLSAAFSALIQHLWIKHRPSKNSLISSFWYLIFLIVNGSIIAGLAFLFIKSDPDMAKLIFSTNQDSSTSSFWDIVASIGSLLAGLGTVGLLAFGLIKGNEWMKQNKQKASIDITLNYLQKIVNQTKKLDTPIQDILNYQVGLTPLIKDFDLIKDKPTKDFFKDSILNYKAKTSYSEPKNHFNDAIKEIKNNLEVLILIHKDSCESILKEAIDLIDDLKKEVLQKNTTEREYSDKAKFKNKFNDFEKKIDFLFNKLLEKTIVNQ